VAEEVVSKLSTKQRRWERIRGSSTSSADTVSYVIVVSLRLRDNDLVPRNN